MNNDTIIIERFSKKRYETYRKKGVPFHVVNGEGHHCEVKAFDCGEDGDKAFVEATRVCQGENRKDAHYVYQKNGRSPWRAECSLYIYRGPWFERNELVVTTSDGITGRRIFFWHGVRPKEKEYFDHWSIYSPYEDMSNSDFTPCTVGSRLENDYPWVEKEKRPKHFRHATDKDIADYKSALRGHRITWEDDGRFYHYPHVGDHYYEIFFNHGVADFRERIFEFEDERPEISRLIMECDTTVHLELREKYVRERVSKINEALGLKK